MYNPSDQGVEFRHEKGRGNGYVLERDGGRGYIAGDTVGTPEKRALDDITFLPMNPPYTMSVGAAADGVLDLAPRRVYPYHYHCRRQDGPADVCAFKAIVGAGNPEIEVVLLDWQQDADR